MAYDYDLFVIGAGSGGVRAARRVGALGHRVGIAEESRYGGTCVIRGCVPKKLLVFASHFSEYHKDAAGYGWHFGEASFDWRELVKRKDAEIDRLESLYRKGLEGANVDAFDARAVLVGPNEVRLEAEDRTVTAERIVVAVGGRPNRHVALEGHELCITSDEALELPELPKKIVIAGGGYIAVEFANIFHGLGVDTTVIYRGQRILNGFDHDVRVMLQDTMEAKGIRVVTNQVFERIARRGDGRLDATLSGGEVIDADQVMLALGRLPNTDGLGLEAAGVKTERGTIPVDAYSRTEVPSIWALGDVTNRVALTPAAIHEAMCFVATEYHGEPTRPDHEAIPTAVFSQPEIGTVGPSEADAAASFEALDVYRSVFRPMRNVLPGRDEKMLMKLLVDGTTGTLVGAHILGPEAGEMAQLLGVAVKARVTKDQLDATMAVHPTAAEELVTMYEPSYRYEHGQRTDRERSDHRIWDGAIPAGGIRKDLPKPVPNPQAAE